MNSLLQRTVNLARATKQGAADARLCLKFGEHVSASEMTEEDEETHRFMASQEYKHRYTKVFCGAGPDLPSATVQETCDRGPGEARVLAAAFA